MTDQSMWLRPSEAAKYIKVGLSTLAKMRCYGGGPRYHKAGQRVVLYNRLDLEQWLQARHGQVPGDAAPAKASGP